MSRSAFFLNYIDVYEDLFYTLNISRNKISVYLSPKQIKAFGYSKLVYDFSFYHC